MDTTTTDTIGNQLVGIGTQQTKPFRKTSILLLSHYINSWCIAYINAENIAAKIAPKIFTTFTI